MSGPHASSARTEIKIRKGIGAVQATRAIEGIQETGTPGGSNHDRDTENVARVSMRSPGSSLRRPFQVEEGAQLCASTTWLTGSKQKKPLSGEGE
jgi:hypothetical protein